MDKKKKYLTLLVVLTICRKSVQEDYEEDVFLNKCQLDTTKIFDSLKEIRDEVVASRNVMSRDIDQLAHKVQKCAEKLDTDLASEERKEPKVAFTVREIVLQREMLNSLCPQIKSKLGNLALTFLSTGIYFFHNQTANHSLASTWCDTNGMRLAQFETLEEMKIVLGKAPEAWYWLGASNIGSSRPDDFKWSDGGKIEKDFWFNNEPNDYRAGNETCVHVHPYHKKINDQACSEKNGPLCELPPKFLACLWARTSVEEQHNNSTTSSP